MTYEVIRIDSTKINKRGHQYRRIVFKPKNYDFNEHPVLFCDVVKGFRNNQWWIPIMKKYDKGERVMVTDLEVRGRQSVNADCHPKIVR